ncbi:MAG: short-chain dehydrogenase [Anaerolineales bacterium]|nr:MAG: short-chain dehydrogenase [Anaerolineales bacterium]
MDIQNRNVLVLGGYGLVGMAVCRELLRYNPGRLVVASLRQGQAESAVERLQMEHPDTQTEIVPAWGDLLLRAEWQEAPEGIHPRVAVLDDRHKRRRLVADILEGLDEDILVSSQLYQLITGTAAGLAGQAADIVIDCVNTATAVAYQNIFQTSRRLEDSIAREEQADWPEEVERLLASLYVPQLVRHMQILYEAMLRAGTQAYVKVGTSGTGGMGLNIPYTHGEERPSRVLLAKSAVAGAQTMLIFLLARTPGGPAIVKEIKPTAAIAWKEINYGPIRSGGRTFPLYDCPPESAYPLSDPDTLTPQGDFGEPTGEFLESVYIDAGENGLFAVGEFTAITTLGQMGFVTPEEIAHNILVEIVGGNTGHDVIAAIDSSVMGPSYRAGFLRQAALNRMRQLEAEHAVDSIAFELLGPPRLSKLLFEAYLLKRTCKTLSAAIGGKPDEIAEKITQEVSQDPRLRQHIISIGIPILLSDGKRLLRGPVNKSPDAEHGWVDLTPANINRWQERLKMLRTSIQEKLAGDTSSQHDRAYPSAVAWRDEDTFDVGEIVGWLFTHQERGRRGKA